jgi:MurNAc alpha-1-phosphate uridylyltransferase
VAPLGPLLYDGMRERRIAAAVYGGTWENVGTPEQLAALNAQAG